MLNRNLIIIFLSSTIASFAPVVTVLLSGIIGSQLIVLNKKLEKFEIIENSSMSRTIDKLGFLHPDSIN